MQHIAVLTCIYPGVERFIPDFVESLARQRMQGFELYVVNDGLIKPEHYFNECKYNVHVLTKVGSPARLRKEGIAWIAREGAHQVVFADIDDCFAENRIEHSVRLLKTHPVVFNELILFGEGIEGNESMFRERFREAEYITAKTILGCNCLGLSNTAANVPQVEEAARDIPDEVLAFDWALFTRLLNQGRYAIYTAATATYYRQHGANIAAPRALGDSDIKRGVRVKALHYAAHREFSVVYAQLAQSFSALDEKINNDNRFAIYYCCAVRENTSSHTLWWESIKTAEELNI